jgi:ATP-dependent Clp protease protease subunit
LERKIIIANSNVYINNRTIYISGDIDNESIGIVNSNLLKIIEEDDINDKKQKDFKREPIKLYINSGGGNAWGMWSIIDIILNSNTPVHTYCTGYAMSAAFEIFLAGHKRYASKHVRFLYHQISHTLSGTYSDIVQNLNEDTYLQNESEEYVIKQTKITQNKLDKIKKEKIDWFIHADEALELGIVHEIIS